MSIIVTKTLPTSSWYTSSAGVAAITLSGLNSIIVNTKKSLTKTQIAKTTGSVQSTGSDNGVNYVRDMKRIEDNIKLNGWLVDTIDSSAWTKAWKLRAMTTTSGPVTSLVIENLTFGTGSQQAFLEEVNFIAKPSRGLGLTVNNTSSASINKTRIEIDLSFYLGTSR
jgi:hypothetical protein